METLQSAKSYFAIQADKGENPDDVAQLILTTAKTAQLSFAGLEFMGPDSFGTTIYFRFRTDLGDINPLIERLGACGRGVIYNKPGAGFMLKTPDGRHGFVPGTRMYSTPRQPRVYRGTSMKLWEEQFAPN